MSLSPIPCSKFYTYGPTEIANQSTATYQTHANPALRKLYQIASFLTKPAEQGLYWALIAKREGIGFGKNRGAGGVPKRFAWIKSMAWMSISLLTLPLLALGFLSRPLLRPGRGTDFIRFMDATKDPRIHYTPPLLDPNEKIHLATFNVAALPRFIDAIKDVLPAEKRMAEFGDWLNRQEEKDLPICLGLQEATDPAASRILSEKTKHLYPYAVTSAGRAKNPFLGANSGIEFHSRVPIKSAAFYPFEDLVGFGVKLSARGVLRLELDLGEGKSALVYVTHTQPHLEGETIRRNEIALIVHQMRYDRQCDLQRGIDRGGHYYLMGDLNVANVDDESGSLTEEFNRLRNGTDLDAPLNPDLLHDPYLEEHTVEGVRTKGHPLFLEKDVNNAQRQIAGQTPIEEPQGSFYLGADQKDRGGKKRYGTKHFVDGPHLTVPNCRYDYIFKLRAYKDLPTKPQLFESTAEIRHVLPRRITTSPLSDHCLLSAIFANK